MLLESRQRRRRIIDSGRQWIVLCVMSLCALCVTALNAAIAHDYSNTGVTVVLGHVSKYTIVYTNMAAITKFSAK